MQTYKFLWLFETSRQLCLLIDTCLVYLCLDEVFRIREVSYPEVGSPEVGYPVPQQGRFHLRPPFSLLVALGAY